MLRRQSPVSFAEARERCERILDGNGKLNGRSRQRVRAILTDYWDNPEAWTLWHRTISLTDGTHFESIGIVRDAKAQFGEQFTTEHHLTMLLDSAIGLVRDSAMCGGDSNLADLALTRSQEAQALAITAGTSWVARCAYAQARAQFELGRVEEAHRNHQHAAALWSTPEQSTPPLLQEGYNSLFWLRAAVRLERHEELAAISAGLFRINPALYGQYAQLVTGGRKGQRHFDCMDIRR